MQILDKRSGERTTFYILLWRDVFLFALKELSSVVQLCKSYYRFCVREIRKTGRTFG
jgi:hypothetical protein